jgi:hypothetical protein
MEISQEDDLEMISENGATSEEWLVFSVFIEMKLTH